MYDFVNLSNREVSYRVLTKQRREEVMKWRTDHDYYVAAEKRRRRLETLEEGITFSFGMALILFVLTILLFAL